MSGYLVKPLIISDFFLIFFCKALCFICSGASILSHEHTCQVLYAVTAFVVVP